MSETPATPTPQPASVPDPSLKEPVKAAEIPAAPPPPVKKGSLFGRFLGHLFSPNTRTGRVVRPIVRGLAVTVGFFALGLLAGYILLYQPLERRYRTALDQFQQAQQVQADQQDKLRLSAESLVSTEAQRKAASDALNKAQARLGLAQAQVQVVTARLALVQNDPAAAKDALNAVDSQVALLKPELLALGSPSTANLDTVLSLTRSDLDRDPHLADQDLQRLSSEFKLLDQGLQ